MKEIIAKYLDAVVSLVREFWDASPAQRLCLVAMCLMAGVCVAVVGLVELPAGWTGVIALIVVMGIFGVAIWVLHLERSTTALRCRNVPRFPLTEGARRDIGAVLGEIRVQAAEWLSRRFPDFPDDDVRTNLFLLAPIEGGPSHGKWKLVMHRDLRVNMHHPREWNLQFSVGQGATGVAFRDGDFGLTRRQSGESGRQWEQRLRVTPKLEALIHPDLRWIVTIPLKRHGTDEAIAVLNIDGLSEVEDDEVLRELAGAFGTEESVLAENLSLQPSVCVGSGQLG